MRNSQKLSRPKFGTSDPFKGQSVPVSFVFSLLLISIEIAPVKSETITLLRAYGEKDKVYRLKEEPYEDLYILSDSPPSHFAMALTGIFR